jgi:hypothetical protein
MTMPQRSRHLWGEIVLGDNFLLSYWVDISSVAGRKTINKKKKFLNSTIHGMHMYNLGREKKT